jgi:hypothetical protein
VDIVGEGSAGERLSRICSKGYGANKGAIVGRIYRTVRVQAKGNDLLQQVCEIRVIVPVQSTKKNVIGVKVDKLTFSHSYIYGHLPTSCNSSCFFRTYGILF